jgi:hypothetical protein
MAENKGGFGDTIDAVSGFVTNEPSLKDDIRPLQLNSGSSSFFLARQPSLQFLQAVDGVLRGSANAPKLMLPVYELGEVNRMSYIGKTQNPPHVHLRDFWKALGAIAVANRDDPGFMEAVGSLPIDVRLRDALRQGPALQNFFNVSTAQENGLRDAIGDANSSAEVAALKFFASSWMGETCLSLAATKANQFHPNI